ncbi:MAG TPA: hypothetical protein DCE78_05825 [Bacteroidetes bacterium]|nr:hypothetical protein [Bacteroidota bacterium]
MEKYFQMKIDKYIEWMPSQTIFRCFIYWIVIGVTFFCSSTTAKAQLNPTFKGYLKNLSGVNFTSDFKDPQWNNIVHNRIESTWKLTTNLQLQADLRARLFTGYTVNNFHEYGTYLASDGGFVDLSRNLIETQRMIFNVQSDRLHLSYELNSLEINVGRQRLNWGKSMVWNPNDLFNNYAYLDFDYEERPGTDAIHVQYSWSFASSIDVGIKLADRYDQAVYAAMLRSNIGTYDVQLIGGKYEDEFVIGGGWSGYLKNAGFKGEMSMFFDDQLKNKYLNASLGADYMLSNGFYLSGEILYNGGYDQDSNEIKGLTDPPKATNLFIAETGYFLNVSNSISPLVNASLGILGSTSESIYIFIPQTSISISEDIDVLILAQLASGSLMKSYTTHTNAVYFRVKLSF